jgi:hypothetical protein
MHRHGVAGCTGRYCSIKVGFNPKGIHMSGAYSSSELSESVLLRWVAITALLPFLMLFAGAGLAADTGTKNPDSSMEAPVKMIAVRVVDYRSRRPLAGLLVEVTSSVPLQCQRPPCGEMEKQQWRGTTDAGGVLRFPASLDKLDAIVYVHAVGSDFGADVHGDGKRDARKRPIVMLEPPALK